MGFLTLPLTSRTRTEVRERGERESWVRGEWGERGEREWGERRKREESGGRDTDFILSPNNV